MRPRPALIIPLIFYLIVSILILIFVPSGSLLYIIPILVGPIGGVASILSSITATQQLPFIVEAYALNSKNRLFTPLSQMSAGFLMLVLFFAISYSAANNFHGAIIASNCDNQATNFFTLFYFSMVTGSTVGYGDFTPEGSARIVAFIQMFLFWVLVLSVAMYSHKYLDLLFEPSPKYESGSWPEVR